MLNMKFGTLDGGGRTCDPMGGLVGPTDKAGGAVLDAS
jgi:hypothetical protein